MDNMFLPDDSLNTNSQQNSSYLQIQVYQGTFDRFFKQQIQEQPPVQVLKEFKSLFIDYEVNINNARPFQVISQLLVGRCQTEFTHLLQHSCYLLIDAWISHNQEDYIQQLITSFVENKQTLIPRHSNLALLRKWVVNFSQSQEYQDLQLFADSCKNSNPERWHERYLEYFLIRQHLNPSFIQKKQELAYQLAKKLEYNFKFDLARYMSHLPDSFQGESKIKNPTYLGDEILRLIPIIIPRRGKRNYQDFANIFLKQVQESSYGEFKKCLQKYLLFSTKNAEIKQIIQHKLAAKLSKLEDFEDWKKLNIVSFSKTCKRVIDFLTTENGSSPSDFFMFLMSCSNPLILAILLLKIVLIAPKTELYIKHQLAQLLEYYQNFPQKDCQWVIYFFEFIRIIFAIHNNNLQYSLIPIEQKETTKNHPQKISKYRVFSQQKVKSNYLNFPNLRD